MHKNFRLSPKYRSPPMWAYRQARNLCLHSSIPGHQFHPLWAQACGKNRSRMYTRVGSKDIGIMLIQMRWLIQLRNEEVNMPRLGEWWWMRHIRLMNDDRSRCQGCCTHMRTIYLGPDINSLVCERFYTGASIYTDFWILLRARLACHIFINIQEGLQTMPYFSQFGIGK